MDQASEKAIRDINAYGHHIIHVLEEDESPSWTYSIGINQTLGKPDVCIMGLDMSLAGSIINNYYRRLKNGESFEEKELYPDFLEGFEVCFKPVSDRHLRNYFGWALWYYKGPNFTMTQLIYPSSRTGLWPWDKETGDFIKWQPILSE